MTTYEKCRSIRRAVLNRAAEVMNYTNWGDEFAAGQIREIPAKLAKHVGEVNIGNLTASQMDDLGFGSWSKGDAARLIPLWLFPFLPDKIESKCIDGTVATLEKSEMDTDHRFGCLAYSVYPSAKEELATETSA